MAEVNAPVLETLAKMNEGTPEASGLDAETGGQCDRGAMGLATAVVEESEMEVGA
ncbi:MAG: hypothetical protein WBV53_14760 [Solirubrobacterales bacterium]